MRFFFDNQLSPYLAESINALARQDGDEVVHKRTKFPPNTDDIDWIRDLSREGDWIVVSGDLDIVRTRAEKPVWQAAGLVGFFLMKGWINITPWDQAWRLIRWWPVIVTQAKIAGKGSTFRVSVNYNGKLDPLV